MKQSPAGGRSAIRGQGLEWRYKGTTISCMFNPPHPGETLKEDILPALGLTVTEGARQFGVTRTALSRVLNGHAAISLEMARRIEAWLGPDRGGRAELWLGLTGLRLVGCRTEPGPEGRSGAGIGERMIAGID